MAAPAIVTANKLNLLGLIGAATGELGLKAPLSIIGNVDPQAIQFLALAKREGKEFYQMGGRKEGWQELRQENIFDLTPSFTESKCVTISGSNVINVTNYTNVFSVGLSVSGTGIVDDTHITEVNVVVPNVLVNLTVDSNSISSSSSTVSLTFSQDAYSLPDDFAYFQQLTWWDRSYRWQLFGPLTAQEWQVLKSGLSPVGPRSFFRIMGNQFFIHPPPSATQKLVFEYFSNAWCQSSAGVAQSTWAADTDYYSLDDDAFILGLKWRFKAAKGLDYAQEQKDYTVMCDRLIARNGGNKDLRTNTQAKDVYLLNYNNIPDTGYGT